MCTTRKDLRNWHDLSDRTTQSRQAFFFRLTATFAVQVSPPNAGQKTGPDPVFSGSNQ